MLAIYQPSSVFERCAFSERVFRRPIWIDAVLSLSSFTFTFKNLKKVITNEKRCVEIERAAGQFDSRSSQANPQLWFQRNVSIGDSPTMVATTNHFPLTCCVKGETIDLIKVDGCLVSIGVSLSFLLFGRWAVKSWSCQVYCSADYNTLNSPSEPIQSRFHFKLKFSMKCVCVTHCVCCYEGFYQG